MPIVLQPSDRPRPRGYSDGLLLEAGAPIIVLAGQIGWNDKGEFDTDDFAGQCRWCFRHIVRLVAEGGGGPTDVVRMTWYVTRRDEYMAAQREIGAAWREIFGKHFPAMTVVFVSGLIDDRAKVEIEAIASLASAVPPRPGHEM